MVVAHDLYVLKSHTELALSTAATLCSLGARLLNPHRSCLLTQDKTTSTKLLSDAGVLSPRFISGCSENSAALPRSGC
jgi:ribosomal protein S6--L-glutamate ligase